MVLLQLQLPEMKNNNASASELRSANRSLFKDLTNIPSDEGATLTCNQHGQQKNTGHGWYARLSDEDKEKYLEKRRIARQQKKSSNMTTLEHDQEACTLDGPSHNVQCTAISNISNTQIDGKMLNHFFPTIYFYVLTSGSLGAVGASAIIDHHQHGVHMDGRNKRYGQNLDVKLFDDRKAEERKKMYV
jgi:hypothetical protein